MPVGASTAEHSVLGTEWVPSKHLITDYAKYIFFFYADSFNPQGIPILTNRKRGSAVEGLDHTDGLRFALRLPDAKASV